MCYCGKPEQFEQCCKPIIEHTKEAIDAEQLMRSRYSAYCVKNIDYIYKTYAPSERVNNSKADIAVFAEQANFLALHVYSSQQQDNKDLATVHFKADYFIDAFYCQLEETSHFVKVDEKWFYKNGTITPHPELKVSRNDKCPCGSNKKFKKCHGL